MEEYIRKETEKTRVIAKNLTRSRKGVNKSIPKSNTENVKEIPKDPTYGILKDVMKDVQVTLAKDTSPSVIDCFVRLGCSITQVQIKMKK